MKILLGKTFGIGNAIMSVPLVRALAELGELHVLCGTGPDDRGAREVFENLVGGPISQLVFNSTDMTIEYDVAVMAIPFDGRWQNGVHYRAKRVLDGRTRPDPSTFGFSSWKKHEVLYQLDNALHLGWTPSSGGSYDMSFRRAPDRLDDKVYLGLGYKKDQAGYWRQKHWGNDRYAAFVDEACRLDEKLYFVTTGDQQDFEQSVVPIMGMKTNGRLLFIPTFGLNQSFDVVGSSGAYVGNDTGMMHVAASFKIPTWAFFGLPGTERKNGPWTLGPHQRHSFYDGSDCVVQDPKELARIFVEWLRSVQGCQ